MTVLAPSLMRSLPPSRAFSCPPSLPHEPPSLCFPTYLPVFSAYHYIAGPHACTTARTADVRARTPLCGAVSHGNDVYTLSGHGAQLQGTPGMTHCAEVTPQTRCAGSSSSSCGSSCPAAVNRGASGCGSNGRCPACHGDCDSDSDCQPGLRCAQQQGAAAGTHPRTHEPAAQPASAADR